MEQKRKNKDIFVLCISILLIIMVVAMSFFNPKVSEPKNKLTNDIEKLQLLSSAEKDISLDNQQDNPNKDNPITKENLEKKENVTKKESVTKKEEKKKNEKNDNNNEQSGGKPSEENQEYQDLAEDAYAESTLEIKNLIEEIGINDEEQIIYAKAITGAGKETLLQAINGIYSIYLSTQGTTIVQIKYKDNEGKIQTYIKKITYKRPEGSTPQKKQPIIHTNLTDQAVYTNNPLNFDIWVTNYRGKELAYNNMEVTINGSPANYVGEMGRQTYRVTLNTGANTIKIKVTDTYQYTVTKTYTVYYKSGKGKIKISLEAGVIGKKYLIKPTTMEIESGTSLAYTIVQFLENYGYDYIYSGSLDDGFYLSKVSKKNMIKGYKIPGSLIKKIEEDGLIFDKDNYENLNGLGEFDFCQGSGWMYSINGVYASYGLDKAYVQDGDTVRIRFTLAYGKDIGGFSVTGGSYGTLKDYGREW